jgi:hypothetical protein
VLGVGGERGGSRRGGLLLAFNEKKSEIYAKNTKKKN